MKNLNKYFLTFVFIFSFEIVSQESSDGEPTTIQGLLQLVEQGRTSEQNVNTQREAEFLVNKKAFKGVQLKTDNMNTSLKTEFVNKIIQKKIAEEILKYIIMNEALTYGDRYLNEYKDFTDLENKLILSKKITSKIELQIGKDIYPYLNKIQKTELDKTMQNSLNLFAINF